jgi:hypothetical protein
MNKNIHNINTLKQKYLSDKFVNQLTLNKDLINKLDTFTHSNKNINLFDPNKQIENKYNKLQKLLCDKNIILTFDKIINSYYRYIKHDINICPKFTSKQLLSLWMIVSFPDLTINKNIYSKDLYFFSCEIIKKIHLLSNNKYLFHNKYFTALFVKSMNCSSNAFTCFINIDKICKLSEMIGQYNDVNETLKLVQLSDKYNEQQKENTLCEIKKTKDKIFQIINYIDKSIERNKLDFMIDMENLREKLKKNTMNKILINDILQKKFIYIPKFLNEIKESLIKLNGKKIILTNENNDIILIDDILDSEIIIRRFINNNFNKKDVLLFGTYLKNIINKLESPIQEIETNKKWKILIDETKDYNIIFVSILFFIIEEINEIKKTIINLMVLTNI